MPGGDDLSPRARARLAKNGNLYGCATCGKIRFPTRDDARRAAKKAHPGTHLSTYRCGAVWHYGNLTPDVIRGLRTRDGRINPDLEIQARPGVAAIMRAIWAATHPSSA